jgi:hypothetical protein
MAVQLNDDDLKAVRTQAQLGFYDALKRGSAAADGDPATAEDATGRQIRNFLDNLVDNANGVGEELPQIKDRLVSLEDRLVSLEDKLDQILAALPSGTEA